MRILAFLLVLSLALAGCSGDEPASDDPTDEPIDDGTQTQTVSATTTQTAAPSETGTSGPEPEVNETNTPPTASLAASITNGEAPVEVNFTLDGADADGDALAWTFDADEDGTFEAEGTELPATVLFEYTVEGVFNATFTVSDGVNQTTQTEAIDVTAAAAPAFEPVHMEQDILLACPHCIGSDVTAATTCIGFAAGEQGLDCWWFEVDPSWIGRTLTVGGGFMMGIEFETSCDGSGTVVGSYLSNEEIIPEGTGCVIILDIIDPVITATADIA